MAGIDKEVIRDGEWVSVCKTEGIAGEQCVEITDSYGAYQYRLSTIPPKDNGYVNIQDTDKSGEKEQKFNEFLESKGLPKYFININKKGEKK